MNRAQVILVGGGVFGLGGLGYLLLKASGVEGFSTGIATSALLMLVVLVWTGSYLVRVISGRMSFIEQRRQYRQAYDAYTDEQLQKRFESLSHAEQELLLRETGQID